MSSYLHSVPILTDGSGVAAADVRIGGGILRAIQLELGTLQTPDIDLTDEPTGTSILSVDGVATDKQWNIGALFQKADGTNSTTYGPVPVMGRIHVAITGGGSAKTGRLVFLIER